MPFSEPSAADLSASLTSSLFAGLFSSATRSTTETLGVGTRIANPSHLPFKSGMTKPIAAAAPVLVGIIFKAAARARRKSGCGKSSVRWSLV